MSGLFESKTKTTVSDPFEYASGEEKEFAEASTAAPSIMLPQAPNIAAYLAENPALLGAMSPEEQQALFMTLDAHDATKGGPSIEQLEDDYYNPYVDDVLGTTLDELDVANRRAEAERAAMEAAIGGPNNSRMGVADALSKENYDRLIASTTAGIKSDAFDKSRSFALQGAGVRDTLKNTAMNRANTAAGALANFGATQRTIEDTNREMRRMAGANAFDWLTLSTQGIGTDPLARVKSLSLQTTREPSTGSQILGAASTIAGMMPSDEALKDDIAPIEDSGLKKLSKLPTYEYQYKPGAGHTDGRTTGLMAQDVENAGIQGGVIDTPEGKMVDSYAVLATVVQAVRELDARTRDS